MCPNLYKQYISLKEYFGGEASEFTPWLSQHIELLNTIFEEEELQLYKREMMVDKFYIDLALRKDKDIYLIENQYGESNHDHLGKCITYSMLTNAKKTCWIAESFSDEYLKIFKYINVPLYLVSISIEQTTHMYDMLMLTIHSEHGTRYIHYRMYEHGKRLEKIYYD